MKEFYEKNEIWFAVLWIVAYVVLFSLGDSLSESTGVEQLITLPIALLMAVVLVVFISKNGLKEYYGLCKVKGSWKNYLWFLPLVVLASSNLWTGAALPENLLKALPAIGTMLLTGLLEELIFRGLLFRAMAKDNQKTAILVGSLTFGIGHIVNLLNGAALVPTLLQVAYATAIGYLFIVIFLKSGSLWPCILTHSAINALSVFATEHSDMAKYIICGVLIVLPLLYALWLNRKSAAAA